MIDAASLECHLPLANGAESAAGCAGEAFLMHVDGGTHRACQAACAVMRLALFLALRLTGALKRVMQFASPRVAPEMQVMHVT